jgi:hypothetical protein
MSHEHSFGAQPKGRAAETNSTKGVSESCDPSDVFGAAIFVIREVNSERAWECTYGYMTR